MSRLRKMSLAINDAELAIGNITDIVKLFESANDATMIRISLKTLRQLANCYPALNEIVNNPNFTCKGH